MAQPSHRPLKTAMIIAQRIVSDIQRDGLVAGDRLPAEKQMLEHYEVGRGTLRESLRYLELQGLIALRPGPGGGPVVQAADGAGLASSLTLLLQVENAPFRTITEARAGIEPMAARLAAERLSEEELETLQQNLTAMSQNLHDERAFLETNGEFHDVIARGSRNPLFAHLIDALTDILDGSAIGITYPEHRREAVLAAHARVYETLRARDANAAADTMREHIEEYSRYAERKFSQVLDSPISWLGRRQ